MSLAVRLDCHLPPSLPPSTAPPATCEVTLEDGVSQWDLSPLLLFPWVSVCPSGGRKGPCVMAEMLPISAIS